MDKKEILKRFKAAAKLLSGASTTFEKIAAVKKLIQGLHPATDSIFEKLEPELATLEKLMSGSVIELAAEQLPELTEEQEKRKKALLAFIRTWNELRGEVTRVAAELNSQNQNSNQSHWMNIVKGAVGPVGLVTVVAVGLVYLSHAAVQVTIKNNGCGTLETSATLPPLPGLSLPKGPIESGKSATATLPPLALNVDGTTSGTLTMGAVGLHLSIELGSGVHDVVFDGTSLLKKKSTINLGGAPTHTLVISCK